MKVQTLIDNINNRYHVQISILELTALEEQLSLEFGEPIVNVGGNFSAQCKRPGETEYTQITFSLPTRHRRVDSDFPITQVFDSNDDCDADCLAKVWAEEICDRLVILKKELLEQSSDFTGETVKTI